MKEPFPKLHTFRDTFLRFKEFISRLETHNYSERALFKLLSHKMGGELKVRWNVLMMSRINKSKK